MLCLDARVLELTAWGGVKNGSAEMERYSIATIYYPSQALR